MLTKVHQNDRTLNANGLLFSRLRFSVFTYNDMLGTPVQA